ncbi:unnamed protein product [Periconia digitata]|uniref:Uncharacterized protein n=1 Tax=Periconia digitata TaxID=1303443 RepID=A0A9W4U9S6_9PLEO|nr:unnamed protein product [Periconia digitata]
MRHAELRHMIVLATLQYSQIVQEIRFILRMFNDYSQRSCNYRLISAKYIIPMATVNERLGIAIGNFEHTLRTRNYLAQGAFQLRLYRSQKVLKDLRDTIREQIFARTSPAVQESLGSPGASHRMRKQLANIRHHSVMVEMHVITAFSSKLMQSDIQQYNADPKRWYNDSIKLVCIWLHKRMGGILDDIHVLMYPFTSFLPKNALKRDVNYRKKIRKRRKEYSAKSFEILAACRYPKPTSSDPYPDEVPINLAASITTIRGFRMEKFPESVSKVEIERARRLYMNTMGAVIPVLRKPTTKKVRKSLKFLGFSDEDIKDMDKVLRKAAVHAGVHQYKKWDKKTVGYRSNQRARKSEKLIGYGNKVVQRE